MFSKFSQETRIHKQAFSNAKSATGINRESIILRLDLTRFRLQIRINTERISTQVLDQDLQFANKYHA